MTVYLSSHALHSMWESSDGRREGSRGISSVYIHTQREFVKKREPGSSRWCPVTAQEATGTH